MERSAERFSLNSFKKPQSKKAAWKPKLRASSEAEIASELIKTRRNESMANTFVHVEGNAYRVFFQDNLKEDHLVSKNRTCSCGEKDCPAIKEVEEYLRNGGRRAPDPLSPCPVCGSEIIPDRSLDGKYTHEPGWQCKKGGKKHFFQAKAKKIQENMAKHPYLYSPVPEDNYPGVRKDELTTWQECQEISERVYRETGYNPAM